MTISGDCGTMRGIGEVCSNSEPDHDLKRGISAVLAGYCIEKGFAVVYDDYNPFLGPQQQLCALRRGGEGESTDTFPDDNGPDIST